MPGGRTTSDCPSVSRSVVLDRQRSNPQMQCYLLGPTSFHFLKHIVHFYRTCFYSCMLMMVLAFGELLSTVFTAILVHGPTLWHGSKCQRFGGIAANPQETLIGFCGVFFVRFLVVVPSRTSGMEGGKYGSGKLLLPVVALKCHVQYQFFKI